VAVFSSQQEAEEVFGAFMEHVTSDPELRPKFVAAATSFRANYTDPDCAVSLVTTVDPPVVKRGDAAMAEEVEVDMFMSTDDGHRFWLGELNIPMALARRKVRVDGRRSDRHAAQAAAGTAAGLRHVPHVPEGARHGRQAGRLSG